MRSTTKEEIEMCIKFCEHKGIEYIDSYSPDGYSIEIEYKSKLKTDLRSLEPYIELINLKHETK